MDQWVYIFGKFKYYVDIDKSRSFKYIAIVKNIKPEAKWSNHEQVDKSMVT